MANFQFTVRATDSDGAYADRNFSITVNNTRVERYMIVDNGNAYTSPDLVNWTTRNSQYGAECAFGNAMWVIAYGLNTSYAWQTFSTSTFPNIRVSLDGVNYSNYAYTALTLKKADGTTFTPPSQQGIMGRLTFSNGYFWLPVVYGWTSTTSQTVTGTYYVARSPDGVNWTLLPMPNAGWNIYDTSYGLTRRPYAKVTDSGTDLFFPNCGNATASFTSATGATFNCYGWKSSDLGMTWTALADSTGTSNGSTAVRSTFVTRINGMYIAANNNSTSNQFMISNDGYNWSVCNSYTSNSAYNVSNIIYANGSLYAFGQNLTASGTNIQIYASSDGVTWTVPSQVNFGTNPSNLAATTVSSLYRNGYLMVGASTNYNSGAYYSFAYEFAGSDSSWTQALSPGRSSPNVPFTLVNSVGAMGS